MTYIALWYIFSDRLFVLLIGRQLLLQVWSQLTSVYIKGNFTGLYFIM